MEVPGLGCLVQVTTQQGNNVAEALCFVPGAQIVENDSGGRSLVDGAMQSWEEDLQRRDRE
jgi:hypothetical protein